jgi:hypothetical protein
LPHRAGPAAGISFIARSACVCCEIASDHSAKIQGRGEQAVQLADFAGFGDRLAFWFVGIYNALITARNGFKNAFAQIDVQLQRPLRPDPQPGGNRQGLTSPTNARPWRR